MELSKEVRELYRNAREEICCDECLSKDSKICPCNEVVRLYQLVEDVVKAERDMCKKEFCATCKWFACREGSECRHFKDFIKSIEGGNENESKTSKES